MGLNPSGKEWKQSNAASTFRHGRRSFIRCLIHVALVLALFLAYIAVLYIDYTFRSLLEATKKDNIGGLVETEQRDRSLVAMTPCEPRKLYVEEVAIICSKIHLYSYFRFHAL
jgi:hypothetical protein